jgi:hypothetical protein
MSDGRDHDGRHPGPEHHGPHGHHEHGHHGHHGHGGHGPEHRHGPSGTEFLQLELSKVVHGEAGEIAVEAARAILRDAIEARLRERLGPRLEALGRIAADELADDVEANLDIEARIAARRDLRQSTEGRVRDALRRAGPAPAAARGKGKRR